tara:strand:+ start:2288 stop:2440 length:153 start_codon:yes stop_codon:yes gene_type:complete
MKKVQLTKEEIEIILHAIEAWAMTNHGEYSKKELRSMDSAQKVLINSLES